MAIPETQLDTWSKQGSVAQSSSTYDMVKCVLEDTSSPYHLKSISAFLQGSYADDTNVYRDSDIDIIMRLDSTIYNNAHTLPKEQYAAFQRENPGVSAYGLTEFKAQVAAWLTKKFGANVKVDSKAIFIPANGSRRDCEVLTCALFRHYYRYHSALDQHHAEGICFFMRDGTQMVNFPKQHTENVALKHQATNGWFKPTVRIYKNMRNFMLDQHSLYDGVAPSYFIEGLLWNVPADKFGISYQDTFINTFNYLVETDRTRFRCANNIHYLLDDVAKESWSTAACQAYLDSLHVLWKDWR